MLSPDLTIVICYQQIHGKDICLQVCEQDVPPQRVRGRRDLSGHPAEPVVAHLRRVRHPHLHPGVFIL